MDTMIGIPDRTEAAPYYFTYIDQVRDGDILHALERQTEETGAFLRGISEEKSLHRYAPGKWSIRESWNHVNDAERVFVSRAMWFACGFETPLPSFEQEIAVRSAHADSIPWERHVDEFKHIRAATLAFFHNMPADAWQRRGTASANPFTVRALAYVVAGHVTHHVNILKERYLQT